VQVANVAPSVDAGADTIVEVGIQLQFSGSFTDPGILDTHTLLWDFGDGDTAEGTLTTTHSFDSAGTYEVTFMVTDDDAGSGSDTLTVTVAEAGSDLQYFVWLPMVLSGD
jgi:PKD repeat protein